MYSRTVIICMAISFLTANSSRSAEKTQNEWSGVMYSKYYLDLSQGSENYNAFEYERLYLNFIRNLKDDWTMRLTTDIGRLDLLSGPYGSTKDGRLAVFIKYIYLQNHRLIPCGSMFLGLSRTPALDVPEKEWGYRSIQRSIIDYNGWGHISDIGVAIKGGLGSNRFNYHLMLANGPGFAYGETDKHKRLMAYVQFNLTDTIHLGGYGDVEQVDPKQLYGNYYTFYVHLGLKTGSLSAIKLPFGPLSAGGELIKRREGVSGDLTAFSVYGNLELSKRVKLLGRVDTIRPTDELKSAFYLSTSPYYSYKLWIAGIDFDLGGGVRFIPNYQIETGERKSKLVNMHLIVSF